MQKLLAFTVHILYVLDPELTHSVWSVLVSGYAIWEEIKSPWNDLFFFSEIVLWINPKYLSTCSRYLQTKCKVDAIPRIFAF